MSAVELSDAEVRHLRALLENHAHEQSVSIRDKVKALSVAPLPVRCYHCHAEQETEAAYTEHLINAHHYVDDEYGEDTAQTEAWTAFNRGR